MCWGIHPLQGGACNADWGASWQRMGGWNLRLQRVGSAWGGLETCLGRKGLHCSKAAGWLLPHQTLPWSPIVLGNLASFQLTAHRSLPTRAVLPVWKPGANPGLLLVQVLGLVRVPLYTQKDRVGGFPNFLSNAFISTAKYQLLFALKVLNMMPEEKLAEAVAAATEKQKKALEKLLPSSS